MSKLALNMLCLAAGLGLLGVNAAPPGAARAIAAEDENPKKIIAAQVRKQGFACQTPQDATRDSEHSKADETAWVLSCGNASYRVILVPDMQARVKRLD